MTQRIEQSEAIEALKTLQEVDLSELLGVLTSFLQKTVDSSTDDSSIELPDPELVRSLSELGFVIDPDTGDVYEFRNIQYSAKQISFLLDIALAINSLYKFIKMIGIDAIRAYQTGERLIKGNSPEKIVQAIEVNNDLINLLINLWENYLFTEGGKPVTKGGVINRILTELLTSQNSPFNRWYKNEISLYMISLRNGVAAAFSGWLSVKNLTKFQIRTPAIEEDNNSVDLVTYDDSGSVIRYYQIKTLSDPLEDNDIIIFGSTKEGEAPSALLEYIYDHLKDESSKDKMLAQIKTLINYSKTNGKPWSWIFVKPNYFVSRT